MGIALQTAGTSALEASGNFAGTTAFGNYIALSLESYTYNTMGVYDSAAGTVGTDNLPNLAGVVNNKTYFDLQAYYNASLQQLTVNFQPDGQAMTQETYNINMATIFGSQWVTMGFFGTTGAVGANHDIVDTWGTVMVPEPGSATLLVLGSLGLFVARRQKK